MNVKKLADGPREDGGAAGVSTSRTGDSPYFRSVLAEAEAGVTFSVSGGLRSQLKQVFGYDDFRPLQREIMEAVVAAILDRVEALVLVVEVAGAPLLNILQDSPRGIRLQ